MAFIPAHEIITAPDARPDRTAFVLHGILGSRGNWRGFARTLARTYPRWRFVLVDLRGHGESQGAAGPHTVAACADDVRRLARSLGQRPAVVVGHSFGGKVALVYARDHGAGLRAAWSLDSPPGIGLISGDHEVARVIEAIRHTPMPAENRQAVVKHFEARGFATSIARWMTTNLRRADDGFRWVFDLPVIDALLADYGTLDLFPYLERAARAPALHLVLAGRSDRWTGETGKRVRALESVTVHDLPNAGHWVHIDDPQGLATMLGASLKG